MSADAAASELTLEKHALPGMTDGLASSAGKAFHLSVITIRRPRKLNAMSHFHYTRLRQLLEQVDADDCTAATLIVGIGKFFSAGADFTSINSFDEADKKAGADKAAEMEPKSAFIARFAAGNGDITQAFLNHRHPLFVGLNGPAVGVSAAMVAYADVVVASPSTYLLTPFASLGLAPEAGASFMLPYKLGPMVANRLLLGGEAVRYDDLARAGFIARTLSDADDAKKGEGSFARACIDTVTEYLSDRNLSSLRWAKQLMTRSIRDKVESHNWSEVLLAGQAFGSGVPQSEFARLASGAKRHKL
ncbi:dodecenoyl-CoA isomerase [Savitreella phatthalungensis]